MRDHSFILTEANWLGEGKIQLSVSEEELDFFTRWHLGPKDKQGKISALQEVQIKGLSDVVNNQFIILDLTAERFVIELENIALGTIKGKGLIRKNLIAWEFHSNEMGFEGFEFYEKQPDETYSMQAEYSTPDQYRTTIKGKIWKKD